MIEQVGRYRVLGNLGKGAMGVVYLAEDPLLNRRVAIKALDLAVEDTARKSFLHDRLLRDARAAAALSHPNIVSVYDVVEQGDAAYLVLEYIAGENLAQRLAAGPAPEPAFTMRVLKEMASALDYTHARGIIHRDVKPSNVMLDAEGTAKIMDFGIARFSDARTGTPTGMVMGTIEYMAPEQIKGEPIDGRADQFALAAAAYEMLTGKTLYGEHSFTTLAYKVVHEMPPPARTYNPALPAGVDEVLARALRKAPAERYASCGEFVRALERAFAGEVAASAAPTQTIVTQTMAAPARKGKRMGVIAAVAGALGLAAGLLVWKPWATPQAALQSTQPAAESTAPASPAVKRAVKKAEPAVKKTAEPPAVVAKAPPETPDEISSQPEPAGSNIPAPALAAYNEGLDLFKAERFPAAVASFTKAIRLKPDYNQAYVSRAQALMRQELWDAAVKDLSEAIRRNPRYHYAMNLRGHCYLHQKMGDLAIADFTRSVELYPNAMGFNGRGAAYLNRTEYRRAISDFTTAIQLQPEFLVAYRNRHKAEVAIGDTTAARADEQKIKALGGGRFSQ